MRRALAFALVLSAIAPPVWAKQEDEDEESDDSGDDEGSDEGDEEAAAPKEEAKGATKEEEDAEDVTDDALRPKQDLSGHDLGTNKRSNEFERDRFFVDKVDTEKTEDATLIQGSIASSTFLYKETGGAYQAPAGGMLMAGNNAGPTRLFTEMRLQTDFRHIKASRWDARIDARARLVPQPTNTDPLTPTNQVQSGLTGKNEYELRELWLVRSGKRSDVFVGRQFVADLGAVKFDGLRVDYAKSAKLTFIAFGGLYPVRGSRSISTDYVQLRDPESGNNAGRFVTTGGFGGAYRTINAYGAIGGVAMYPLQKESPRFYVTSQGYLRSGSKLDFYHFALVDLLGSNATEAGSHIQLTNLSAGVNVKPNPRLRLTASFNRVDTETLNVQAAAFLDDLDTSATGNKIVQNDAQIIRLATDAARAGVSAGLGKNQRFEISTALSIRRRPELTLRSPDNTVNATVPAAQSVEVWASIVDRHSIKQTRIGLDGGQTFGIGDVAYQRSEVFMGRLFVNREIANGRGEWEGEANYSKVKDSTIGQNLTCTKLEDCFGTSNSTVMSVGGQLFYRLKADWFGIGTLHLMRIGNKRSDGLVDPPVTGITGFVRIAKRF
ncbi:MAG TPA: hypothetical protein VFV99_04575 [Kofleriaceae bacterium]|nr:hypothetical protein [Kofleriaceae bacterium]